MFKWFTRTTRHLETVLVWIAAFTLLWAAMSWLGKHLSVFGSLPWPEAIFLGLGATLLTALIVTGSLALWRIFRPLPPRSPVPLDHVDAEPDASFASGLYVGEIRLAANHLEDHYLEMSVRGFNGTGHPVSVAEVSGNIRLAGAVEDQPDELVTLTTPALLGDRSPTKDIPPRAEFLLVLHQHLDKKLAETVGELIVEKGASFDLKKFRIEMMSADDPKMRAALPFWAGIFVRRDGWARSDRIIHLEVQDVVIGAVTMGRDQSG